MDDKYIVELFFMREELALELTASKYGAYCRSIAYNILASREDAEECVNDTYLAAWNAIPPHRPTMLSTFLGKITRRICTDRLRSKGAQKRGTGELDLIFDELEDCIPDQNTPDSEFERSDLKRIINEFLGSLRDTERKIFLCRYWYAEPIASICKSFGFSDSRVKSILFRTRKKLKDRLIKEGYNEIK